MIFENKQYSDKYHISVCENESQISSHLQQHFVDIQRLYQQSMRW